MARFQTKQGTGRSGKPPEPKSVPTANQLDITTTEPPDHLNAEAQAFWRKTLPLVREYMTAVDLDGFAQVAFAYSMMLAAQRDIDENGLKTINERGILIKNPAVAAYRDFFNMFYSIGGRYGLDPSARAKLINEQQDKPTDAASPLAGLIR